MGQAFWSTLIDYAGLETHPKEVPHHQHNTPHRKPPPMTEEVRTLVDQGWPFAVAVIAVTIRLLVTGATLSFRSAIRAILVGCFVGVAMGGLFADMFTIMSWEYGTNVQNAAIAVSAIIADDIVLAVVEFGKRLRRDPVGLFMNMIRGGKK